MGHIPHEAAIALYLLFTPMRMGLLLAGVMLGLVIGLIPGLGGIVGLSLLLPFTFGMDPYSAMAILIGLAAAASHGDVIPAVLFGVPGTVGCQATIMDGYPMAKRGQAGRALGAAFNASLLGGLFGAMMLAVAIPVVSPLVMSFGTPELLSICVFGITLVASLSGNAPLRGLVAASIGLLLSMIGQDSQTATLRFTFDTLYLWSGLPVVPVALGIFAVPELCDIMVNRASIAAVHRIDAMSGQWQGWKDAFGSWFLVLRTSMLGAACAMVPGLGAPVIDWIAYGHAAKTEKGARQSFGHGDVRGVIAAESSTNAREGGSLATLLAFGIPANPSTAILLGAFLIQGIVPGPDMLTKHLDITYSIVWSLTLANVFGTLICFSFANQFARIATIRYTVLLPVVMTLVFIGAFQGERSWGDIVALLLLGSLGWVMKRCGWPRPPLILGFILGKLVERYTFISVERYGWRFLTHWFVALMLALSLLSIIWSLIRHLRANKGRLRMLSLHAPRFSLNTTLALLGLLVFIGSLFMEMRWQFGARLVPMIISTAGTAFATLLLVLETFENSDSAVAHASHRGGMTMDLRGDYGSLNDRQIYVRAIGYFVWIYAVMAVGIVIGLLPALVLFTLVFMRFHGHETWKTALVTSSVEFLFLWIVFDHIVHEPWPQTIISAIFPGLRGFALWF